MSVLTEFQASRRRAWSTSGPTEVSVLTESPRAERVGARLDVIRPDAGAVLALAL
ncbi:MAG: hypothetical protein ABEJ58_10345 [Halodesulfurarchaeum sp.]